MPTSRICLSNWAILGLKTSISEFGSSYSTSSTPRVAKYKGTGAGNEEKSVIFSLQVLCLMLFFCVGIVAEEHSSATI